MIKILLNYLELIPLVLKFQRRLSQNSIFLHKLPELNSKWVIREDFLQELSYKKRVLHFGFLDYPFTSKSIESDKLLHLKLKAVSSYLHGVDIDKESLKSYQELTNDYENSIFDIQTDLSVQEFSNNYDLILFPEVLEHLKNPENALKNLLKICQLNINSQLCITVPNAFSASGFLAALNGYEIVHPQHYYYFSPITLKRLLQDVGFSHIDIFLYSTEGKRRLPGLVKGGVIALCRP